MRKFSSILIGVVLVVLGLGVGRLSAGSPDSPGGPTSAGAQMYTLEQIYQRLNTGAAETQMTTFTEPGTAPGTGTMHTLNEIYNLIGLRAPVPKTGQTVSTLPTDDGDLQKGVAWPNPRFTNNNNGTVTDNLTGLIWLKNANCTDTVGGVIKSSGALTWANALTWSSSLAAGNCGLTDGSVAGAWRLPNARELQSLVDYGFWSPAVPNTAGTGKWTAGDPFDNVQVDAHWSSSTAANNAGYAWYVILYTGTVNNDNKTNAAFVWPVRDGQ